MRETKEVMDMRRITAMVAAAAMAAVALSGCADKIAGSPATDAGAAGTLATITGGSSAVAERATGIGKVQCTKTTGTLCQTSAAITPTDVPSGTVIDLRAGDPIAFSTSTRHYVTSIGAFVTDGNTVWAIAGSPPVVPSKGTAVTTTSGAKIGTVALRLEDKTAASNDADGSWDLLAVRIGERVKSTGTVSGARGATDGERVTVTAPTAPSATGTLIAKGQAFNYPVPSFGGGDAGAPVAAGTQLVGFLSNAGSGTVPWTRVEPTLSQLGSGVRLLTI